VSYPSIGLMIVGALVVSGLVWTWYLDGRDSRRRLEDYRIRQLAQRVLDADKDHERSRKQAARAEALRTHQINCGTCKVMQAHRDSHIEYLRKSGKLA
jgi:hypothetical protein